MNDYEEKAKEIIEKVFFMNIASMTEKGLPWNTPVYFSYDDRFNFYWYSPYESQHSANINNNPEVFLTIYLPGTGGVYIKAKAQEIEDRSEAERILKIFKRGDTDVNTDPKNYFDKSPLRIYKAVPYETYVATPQTATKYEGLWVDKRIKIRLTKFSV